jgi:hypothetical protein
MPDRWSMESAPTHFSDTGVFVTAQLKIPEQRRGVVFGAPASKNIQASGGGLFGKVWRAFGRTIPKEPQDDDFARAGQPLSKADRAAIEKSIADLGKLLNQARAVLDAGRIPPAEPIEQGRQAVIRALRKTGGDTPPEGLQKFLRSTLVELIAVLASGSVASARPILERVQKEFDRLMRQRNFWEATV